MAIFEYKGIDEAGNKTKGVIDADSLTLAKERLKELRMVPLALSQVSVEKRQITLSPPLLLSFTRELAQLLKAGLPLYECLLTVEEKHRKTKHHPLFLHLCDAVKNGQAFSSALKEYSKTFNPIYLCMVESAEASGALAYVFQELTKLLSKEQKLKKKLQSTFAYPAFLGGFCLFLVLGLFLFVIPSLEELFDGRRLHPLTEAVLALSRATRQHGLTFLGVIFLTVTGLSLLSRRKKRGSLFKEIALKLPLIKKLVMTTSLVRFFRSCSLLLQGGVPLVRAIILSKKVTKHRGLEALIERGQEKISEGELLSQQLIDPALIPSMIPRMLAIAEQTGEMGAMMQSIADIYEDELEREIGQLISILQPALLLFLGLVVGVVLLSILLPLTDVNSFLG